MKNPVIELENVSLALDGKMVLEGVTFGVERGEFFCITGPHGTGQTLLLKLCAELLPPTTGTGRRNLQPVGAEGSLMHAGFVFEYGGLISNLTVFNNIALPLRYHTSMPEEEIADKAREALALLNITEFSDVLPARLSVGTRKLASVARAIAMRPQIIYYDEPTLGLDRDAAQRVESVMRQMRERGATSLVVSHSAEFVKRSAERAVVLIGGRMAGVGRVDELSGGADPYVRNFFG